MSLLFTNTVNELKLPDLWEAKCFFQGLQYSPALLNGHKSFAFEEHSKT